MSRNKINNDHHIILASGSPRRQEFFRLLNLPFTVQPADIDEHFDSHCLPAQAVKNIAVAKVRRILELTPEPQHNWICAADTIVRVDNTTLGKPKDQQEAREMLLSLSDKEHNVISAVALYNRKKDTIDCRCAECTVYFSQISPAEADWYIKTGEWQGVAGAYRLQGLAACFIKSINGAPSTVIGLPLFEFYAMLRENGYPFGA